VIHFRKKGEQGSRIRQAENAELKISFCLIPQGALEPQRISQVAACVAINSGSVAEVCRVQGM
jgi:hypothetical protein